MNTSFTLISRPYCFFGIDPETWKLIAAEIEEEELELSAQADARMRLKEISPSLYGQIYGSNEFRFSSVST